MTSSRERKPLRVLVAPDSFKGSLPASSVAASIAAGVRGAIPDALVTEAPMADGGEGSASAIAQGLGGSWQQVAVQDANGRRIEMPFAACTSPALGSFAVLDVAEIVGLPAAVAPPGARSTRGVGQAIRAIHERGFRTIALGLGGSSTNDAGAGLLAELAFICRDAAGRELDPVFDNLMQVDSVERRPGSEWLAELALIGLTDVTSPLNGPEGGSMIFGRQKGFGDLAQADGVLAHFAACCTRLLGEDRSRAAGAGAAGGLGFAVTVLGGSLRPGAQFVLEAHRLVPGAIDYDWVITGEGRSDAQTLLGKGPAMVARLARDSGIPVTLLSGAVEFDPALEAAFDGCLSIQPGPVSLEYAMQNAGTLLQQTARQVAALFMKARG
ncbi:glycerate kinase [Massilia sp. Mn16-1_5]|uniref:glycerate kinase n=1 Tax=Massilia sp. Mn16-1_5 TaxID=2079199 RepID=UPI00109E7ACD|nr:glycerate kinase [Massilia sp. Mn16-1_5]THC45729.1 glycerate kinase [Massilia sp. Mn16-1_5]